MEEAYTRSRDVDDTIQPLKKRVLQDKQKCMQCSACIAHCPSQALHIKDRRTMIVEFEKEWCIQCGACIPLCPFGAMSFDP